MKRKKNVNYYYETFVEMIDYSLKAAELLNSVMSNFKRQNVRAKIKEMHLIEHSADELRHKMIKKLAREFITPIEREDIMALANAIDTLTDMIEDVLIRIYMYNIQEIKEYAIMMVKVVVRACHLLKEAFEEFPNFRKSEKLHRLIVEVNKLEEEGDALYTEATRNIYVHCDNCKELLGWDMTYHYLEKCCDACEDVADILENIIMKNT
ncbi:hypothetical protein SAMN05660826_00999 [Caldanaerovirga acetigignens]|uniref:Phosphate transport regulator (Distant homolog of PhoU) n=1 Tax=Caldanaerovirga acetigignens TaxID=447595 RepID=A0A1M7IQR5_9FIRM|nr:DUF47 family protein [Caldanaerovirga acetigignens]SHM43060.1 hypothetical protein SAMN05660826_00999 [Caldanaerovirga acetigignens]